MTQAVTSDNQPNPIWTGFFAEAKRLAAIVGAKRKEICKSLPDVFLDPETNDLTFRQTVKDAQHT